MATIILSDLDYSTMQQLKLLAVENNHSVEDEALRLLKCALFDIHQARQKELLEKIKPLQEEQRRRGGNHKQTASEILVREDRDSDHGRLYDPWGLDDSGN